MGFSFLRLIQHADEKKKTCNTSLENARIELAASRMRSERSTPELKKAMCQIPQVELSFSPVYFFFAVQYSAIAKTSLS